MILVAVFVNEGFFLAIFVLLFYIRRFPRKYWLYFCVCLLAFGWLRLSLRERSYPFSEEMTTYYATVREIRRQRDDRQTAIIDIAGNKVFLTYPHGEPRLLPGDIIAVKGRIRKPTNPTVPHQFNFKRHLRTQGIGLTLYATSLTKIDESWSIWRYQYQILEWLEASYPPLTAAYIQALFLGVRDGIEPGALEAYNQLGILHLFAISGLHVALLTTILMHLLKRIGLIQNLIDLFVFCFLGIFIIITGASASIVRAGGMMMLALLNRRFKWQLSAYDIFAIVFMINFIINPRQIYQSGFIFSYWITFVLISTQSFFREFSPLKITLFIPFMAQLAGLPIRLAGSYEFNLVAYLNNLLLVPLVTYAIIPLLLLALVIPQLSLLTEHVLVGFEELSLLFSQRLNVPTTFGALTLEVILLLAAMLLFCCWYFGVTKKSGVWLGLILAYAITLEGQRLWRPNSQITFLDVGQGESTVIQSPFQSCTVIIDTGGIFSFSGASSSIFSRTLEPFLLGEGIRRVDYLILTHEHFDHIGEAIPLLERFTVTNLVISEATPTGLLKDIIRVADEQNTAVLTARPHDVITCANQIHTFIHQAVRNMDINEESLVSTLAINDFTVLFTGDIGFPAEATILKNYSLSGLDIYHVAHHGSRFSNSMAFLESLSPRYAVVSAGRNNFYGHPSRELFEVVNDLNIPLLNTQNEGTIQFKINRRGYQIFIYPPDF